MFHSVSLATKLRPISFALKPSRFNSFPIPSSLFSSSAKPPPSSSSSSSSNDTTSPDQQQALAFQSLLYTPSNASTSTTTTPPSLSSSSSTTSTSSTSSGSKKKPNSNHHHHEDVDAQAAASSWTGLLVLSGLCIGGFAYLGRPMEDQELTFTTTPTASTIPMTSLSNSNALPQAWSLFSWYQRAKHRCQAWFHYYQAPAFDVLLPDPLPYGYQKPYTLILNLNDMLIHSFWDPQFGWRIVKRPGIDTFLGYLARYYEIVVFTSSQAMMAQPILDQLDTYQSIMYRLYRDATKYEKGQYKKDLTHLNRDLSKVLVLDVDAGMYSSPNTENTLILPKWKGDPKDQELVSYLPFLETLALSNVNDVRPVLKAYKDHDLHIPTAFAERQAQLKRLSKSSTSFSSNALDSNESTSHGSTGLTGLFRRWTSTSSSSSSSSSTSATSHSSTALNSSSSSSTPSKKETSSPPHFNEPLNEDEVLSPSPVDSVLKHAQFMQKQFQEESSLIKREVDLAKAQKEEELQQWMASMKKKMTLWEVWSEQARQIMMASNPNLPTSSSPTTTTTSTSSS